MPKERFFFAKALIKGEMISLADEEFHHLINVMRVKLCEQIEIVNGQRVHGNVMLVFNPETIKPYSVKDQLIVLTQCSDSYLPLIKEALGVILQNQIDDTSSEQYLLEVAKTLDKPVIIRADVAYRNLREGQLVTLDPEKALVYNVRK